MTKPKIAIVISHYSPGYKIGGPVTALKNIINAIKDTYEIYLITSNTDYKESKPYEGITPNKWVFLNGIHCLYLSKNMWTSWRLISALKKIKVHVIYVSSLLDHVFSMPVALAIRFKYLKVPKHIIAPRGEFFDESLQFSTGKKNLFFALSSFLDLYKHSFIHATTQDEVDAIQKFKRLFRKENILLAHEIPDRQVLSDDLYKVSDDEGLKIVCLSRIAKDKNLLYIIDVLMLCDFKITMDFYGPIEDQEIFQNLMEKFLKLPSSIQVKYQGVLPHDQVKIKLVEYDVFFLPSFSESYGHSIIESLSVGLPVLISDQTPWKNLRAKNLGRDIPLQNFHEYKDYLQDLYALTPEERLAQKLERKAEVARHLYNPSIIEENINLFKHY